MKLAGNRRYRSIWGRPVADIVTPEVRSRMMSGIRSRNTKPELLVRRGLHARGFRFRLHDRRLPGVPDLVFPRYRSVIFTHGCFWHGHECQLFRWPASNTEFWRNKIERNRAVDERSLTLLRDSGWRVMHVWECAVRGRQQRPVDDIMERLASWLTTSGDDAVGEIAGIEHTSGSATQHPSD